MNLYPQKSNKLATNDTIYLIIQLYIIIFKLKYVKI
jgi:hypothetical protein